jgi:hypothetical protein
LSLPLPIIGWRHSLLSLSLLLDSVTNESQDQVDRRIYCVVVLLAPKAKWLRQKLLLFCLHHGLYQWRLFNNSRATISACYSSAELAECFGDACPEGLSGRERDRLGQCCELLGLLGQRLELLA